MSTASQLLDAAKSKGLMIAAAESCTAGLISGAITDVAGSSEVFERGFVTYTNQAKIEMLGVRPSTLDAFGAVSEPVAREMALGALSGSPADIAIAVTGIAGPGGSEHKPEGRVCFGLAHRPDTTFAQTLDFGALGRSRVRAATVDHALSLLLSHISQTD